LSIATVATLAFAMWLTPPTPATEGDGQITGRVIDASTQAPIAGIEVCALAQANEPNESEETCENTGATGEYTIPGLAIGEYVVSFGVPFSNRQLNYVTQYYDGKASPSEANPVSVTAGNTISGIDAKLAEGGRIEGRVTDASSGSPLGAGGVCAIETNTELGRCASTSSDGEYTISGLAAGEYKVGFIHAEYVTEFYDDKLTLAEANPVAVAVGKTTSGIDAAQQPEPPARPEDKTPPQVIVIPPENGPEPPGEGPAAVTTATVGTDLACYRGAWTGNPRPTFAYTWLRGGKPIVGATEPRYVVAASDAGHTLACRVTAENSQGEASATSAGVTIAGGASGGDGGHDGHSGGPSSHPMAHITIESAKLSRQARTVRAELRCSGAPCKGSIELTALVVGKHSTRGPDVHLVTGPVLARGSFSLAKGHSATVLMRLTPIGRRRLAHAARHPLPHQFVISVLGTGTNNVPAGPLGSTRPRRASRHARASRRSR
jgi:hypothetical protein